MTQARKTKLLNVLTDDQMRDFSADNLGKLANGTAPLSVDTVTNLVLVSRRLLFSEPLFQTAFTAIWLDRYSYPTCEPSGKNAELFSIAITLNDESLDITGYLSTFLACTWQNSVSDTAFLDFLQPRTTELLYKLKLFNIPFGAYDQDYLFKPDNTSLDAKMSTLVPDIGFELGALSSLMSIFGSDSRIQSTDFSSYCLQSSIKCEPSSPDTCVEIKPSYYDFERLGCYFHIVKKTSNIVNFDDDTAELKSFGPLGTGVMLGFFARKYKIWKGTATAITYTGDIHYTIGEILAKVGKTFDYLLDTRTPSFQALVNARPGFKFVNATIGRNLWKWWYVQNGFSLIEAEEKANREVEDDWITALNADLVISLFTALSQIAGLPTTHAITTNVDYWKQNLGLNSTSQFATKSVELYPYCQLDGDPNIGCLASVALGCYGKSESSCSQSYTTNIFRGKYADMKSCSSYLGYQIRTLNCKKAVNNNAVLRAILAYGLNMPPQPGSTTSVMNAFYPSGKCEVSKGGKGFIAYELTADGKDLTLYFGDLNHRGNVLKCDDAQYRETLQSSC